MEESSCGVLSGVGHMEIKPPRDWGTLSHLLCNPASGEGGQSTRNISGPPPGGHRLLSLASEFIQKLPVGGCEVTFSGSRVFICGHWCEE